MSAQLWPPRTKANADQLLRETSMPLEAVPAVLLGVVELTEMVFLRLPLRDILVIQRVCKAWKSCIQKSPSIQKALFLQPASEDVLRLIEPGVDCAGGFGYTQNKQEVKASWAIDDVLTGQHRLVINPILGAGGPAFDHKYGVDSVEFMGEAYKYAEASWRKMLFTQPPVNEFIVTHGPRSNSPYIGAETNLTLWFPTNAEPDSGGLTMDYMANMATYDAASMVGSIRSIAGEEDFVRLSFGNNGVADVKVTAQDVLRAIKEGGAKK